MNESYVIAVWRVLLASALVASVIVMQGNRLHGAILFLMNIASGVWVELSRRRALASRDKLIAVLNGYGFAHAWGRYCRNVASIPKPPADPDASPPTPPSSDEPPGPVSSS